MSSGRAPGPGTPPPPRPSWLFSVRWRDSAGETKTRLLHKAPAAERLVERLRARGADPLVFVHHLGDWQPW